MCPVLRSNDERTLPPLSKPLLKTTTELRVEHLRKHLSRRLKLCNPWEVRPPRACVGSLLRGVTARAHARSIFCARASRWAASCPWTSSSKPGGGGPSKWCFTIAATPHPLRVQLRSRVAKLPPLRLQLHPRQRRESRTAWRGQQNASYNSRNVFRLFELLHVLPLLVAWHGDSCAGVLPKQPLRTSNRPPAANALRATLSLPHTHTHTHTHTGRLLEKRRSFESPCADHPGPSNVRCSSPLWTLLLRKGLLPKKNS